MKTIIKSFFLRSRVHSAALTTALCLGSCLSPALAGAAEPTQTTPAHDASDENAVVSVKRNPVLDHMSPEDEFQQILGNQEGIPFHRIQMQNAAHDDVDIKLDGKVDEAIWQTIHPFDNMIVSVPFKGVPGEYATETRMLATEKGLFVSAIMKQPPDSLVERYSVRDDFIDRDTFGVTLDVSGEGLVGYWFIVALGDGQMDGKVLPERNYQRDWDGPWIGKSARRDDGWSIEMYLPWSMMNMPETGAMRNIGFALSRQGSFINERYQWPGYPYSSARFVSALNQADVAGVHPRQQLSAIPYISLTNDRARGDNEARVGVDISWKPSPKLETTASLNPDFGAVEADDVVLNLKAAETFYPEKRLFFLEGNEVFDSTPRSNTGSILRVITNEDYNTTSRKIFITDYVPPPISLMNTKRIGGAATQPVIPAGISLDNGETDRPTKLLGAAKVVGQLGKFRYGVLGAAEDEIEWFGRDNTGKPANIRFDGRDFAVARLVYENVKAARSAFGYMGTRVEGPLYTAQVHSLDAHYTSADGELIVDGLVLESDVNNTRGSGAMFDWLYNQTPNLRHKVEVEYFDEDVNINDLGFLSRNDYAGLRYIAIYNKQKPTTNISNYRSTLVVEQSRNVSENQRVGGGVYWRNHLIMPGRNTLRTAFAWFPERWEDIDSRGNGAYLVEPGGWINLNLATDAASMVSLSASVGAFTEDSGSWTESYTLGATFRPWGNVSVDLDFKYKRRNDWLVYQGNRNFGSYDAEEWTPSLKFNWFITPAHQVKLSLQWVGVDAHEDGFWEVPLGDGKLQPGTRTLADHDFTVSRLTTQLRYRWEIAPLSDFFLVYNLGNGLPNQRAADFDDLFSDTFDDPTIESFVAKLRYRFGN
ncbi:MAG: hypothetical protein KDI36_09305 [Pseudomonadales bacterium]|nr:hypothetical protein [Pseudomonadales bacterium]